MNKKLWGGRFKKKPQKDFFEFQKSISYDWCLARYDLYHSLTHVEALAGSGILKKDEAGRLSCALRAILVDIQKGKFRPDETCEDIHSDIQNRVEKKVGKLAAKLHTLRSRNDQIVYDEKMYCLSQGLEISRLLSALLEALSHKYTECGKDFFVGYTHTRRAQVVYFGDYLAAYASMFLRDYQRLARYSEDMKIYLGSGALAGSALDPRYYRQKINIEGLVRKNIEELNSPMDNVSDRDHVLDLLYILAALQTHLSRLAEDLILYSSAEFDLIDIPEQYCTGSSLMPHKKNPDFLELMRGHTGNVYGNLVSVLTMMKGLPLTYNRDMQLDKEPLFSSVGIIKRELTILSGLWEGLRLKKSGIARALADESLYATEIAQYLVFTGVAFGDAHQAVGKLIRYCEDNGVRISDMADGLLSTFSSGLTREAIRKVVNPHYAVSTKRSVVRRFPKIK